MPTSDALSELCFIMRVFSENIIRLGKECVFSYSRCRTRTERGLGLFFPAPIRILYRNFLKWRCRRSRKELLKLNLSRESPVTEQRLPSHQIRRELTLLAPLSDNGGRELWQLPTNLEMRRSMLSSGRRSPRSL